MNCLEKYRSKLVTDTNRNLRVIVMNPDREAIHKFRVGVKRLTALYRLLGVAKSGLKAKKIVRPARALSRSISKIRDSHITQQLISEMEVLDAAQRKALLQALNGKIRNDYRAFRRFADEHASIPLRLPSIRSMALGEATILRHKPLELNRLLTQVLNTDKRLNARQWHDKRILLKRYHHSLDAFQFCPGHTHDEEELKQMKMLEQLLGDWHDRVVAVEILSSFTRVEAEVSIAVKCLKAEERLLLGAARIYLARFAIWHQQN